MRRIPTPVVALLAVALAGCVGVLPGTRQAGAPAGGQPRVSAKRVEAGVDRARIAANLAVLTGKTPMAPGLVIPERGTVDGRALTRRYLTETLTALGYQVEKHTYRKNGENLFVRLPAAVPTEEWILVGAHMDSVRNAGADDNGSGSTAVLEAATLLKDLADRKVNLMFAWFDEEELGLIGSAAMARDFRKQGMKLSSVHTVDMIGWDGDKDRAIEVERPDGGLWDYYKMVNERHGLGYPLARTNSGATDHVAFRAEGFASVGLCEEWAGGDTTPYYHRKSDTYDSIDLDFLAAGSKLLVAAVGDLATKVPAPAAGPRLPHHMFPGRDRHFHGEH